MTKQRAYQLRHLATGRCVLCPAERVNQTHCARHRDLKRAYVKHRRVAQALAEIAKEATR